MSLKPARIPPVPEETARVARAVFPRGNVLMQVRDTLGTIYSDEAFADLFPTHGQPAEAPWRLALVTVFQFVEHLTDRQATDAVRSRLDWKYALSLDLTDPGFDHTVLSEFRSRLIVGNAEQRLLDLLLERCRAEGWLKARGRQRTDSTHILAKIRALNRVLCVAQTMVYVLNVLAEVAPEWVRAYVPVEWVERYGERLEHEHLPQGEDERNTMGLRRSRYVGLHKTHLGHIAIATAINITQLMGWLRGEAPAQTRTSPFKKLMHSAA